MDDPHLLTVNRAAADAAVFREAAEAERFSVVCTSSAADFMAAFERFRPAVIALDTVLPDGDGFGLIYWLIEQGWAAHVLVIPGGGACYTEAIVTLGEKRGGMRVRSLEWPVDVEHLRQALRDTRSRLSAPSD